MRESFFKEVGLEKKSSPLIISILRFAQQPYIFRENTKGETLINSSFL